MIKLTKFHSLIIGAPGSGKGTISRKIISHFNIQHISSGDILRYNISRKTDLGKSAEQYVSTGKLVPDSIIQDMMTAELKPKLHSSWLLDGYPRTKEQCYQLEGMTGINCVINLDIPFATILMRLRSRWIHAPSGRIYNVGYNDPKIPGKDDITGEDLIQRKDDTESVIIKRLNTYADNIKPIIEYYKRMGLLENFHGISSDEIWPKVKIHLESVTKKFET